MCEEKQELVTTSGQAPNQLIALALEKGADPGTLERLMDLQERWEANQAKKAYVLAMTRFKIEAPAVIAKTDKVDFTSARGRTTYNYANLGTVIQEITALLGKHELSVSWKTAQEQRLVTVSCRITHSGGYSEDVTLTGPVDDSGNKNAIQAIGSVVTYLQRYTLLAALGLATGEDDDGRQGAPKTNSVPVSQPPAKTMPPAAAPSAQTKPTQSAPAATKAAAAKPAASTPVPALTVNIFRKRAKSAVEAMGMPVIDGNDFLVNNFRVPKLDALDLDKMTRAVEDLEAKAKIFPQLLTAMRATFEPGSDPSDTDIVDAVQEFLFTVSTKLYAHKPLRASLATWNEWLGVLRARADGQPAQTAPN
jgi:hypothetical protein